MGRRAVSATTSLGRRQSAAAGLGSIGIGRHSAARRCSSLYPVRRPCFLHLPDRRLFADPRDDRAVADAACRLWRHGQPGADDAWPASPATWSRSSASTRPASWASAGRGGSWCRSRIVVGRAVSALIGLHRGPHGRHLHDHDHAGDRHRLLLLRPAELFAVQRPFRASPASAAAGASGGSTGATPVPFYYLCLAIAALCYVAVLYVSRSTFGLALQAIRDNPRRMRALGFNVIAHKVAAYFLAGLIAGLGRRPAGLVQRPHLAGHGRRRRRHRHAGHRRDRRHAPSDRALRRRCRLRAAQDLRHRPGRTPSGSTR